MAAVLAIWVVRLRDATGIVADMNTARNVRRILVKKYAHVDEYDSFITHRNQKSNLEKLQAIGEEKYILEQQEKRQILDRLLDEYNDGRKKTLYCLAVNLMDLQTLKEIMAEADRELRELPLKERSSVVAQLLKDKSDVELKQRKKLDKYYGI